MIIVTVNIIYSNDLAKLVLLFSFLHFSFSKFPLAFPVALVVSTYVNNIKSKHSRIGEEENRLRKEKENHRNKKGKSSSLASAVAFGCNNLSFSQHLSAAESWPSLIYHFND